MAVTPLPIPDADVEELEFDLNSLTLGEVEVMEDIVGRDVMRELSRGTPSVKTLVALVYVIKHRDDVDFTIDDARAMKVMGIKAKASSDPKETGV